MMPLGDDDELRAASTPSTPVGSGSGGRGAYRLPRHLSVTSTAPSKRHVQFSEHELETTQHPASTQYPTPQDAKQVIHNTSSRRLAIDEVELRFSEPTRFPPALDDYVVDKFAKRDELIVASALELKEVNALGMWRWKPYWVELYNGVLMFHKKDRAVDREPKKVFVTGCRLHIVDLRECVVEIHHTFQQRKAVKLIKCQSKADLFLWWWAIQLASVLKTQVPNRNFLPPLQLVESGNRVEHVLYPRPTRATSSKRTDFPSVTHLLLVRHGEAENMHFKDSDKKKGLTKRGREQAVITAKHIASILEKAGADESNVQLVFGGLYRTFETAKEFKEVMPWLTHANESCLLEEGAPDSIKDSVRMDFRAGMHRTAYETICRHDPNETQRRSASNMMENFKILICHTSFVQHCIAQTYGISNDVVKIGAPIGHCSITQIDVFKNNDKAEHMEVAYTNRVQHLKLTHRTSE